MPTTTTTNNIPIYFFPPDDPSREQTMKLVEDSGVLDFWREEVGYETEGE